MDKTRPAHGNTAKRAGRLWTACNTAALIPVKGRAIAVNKACVILAAVFLLSVSAAFAETMAEIKSSAISCRSRSKAS